MTRGKAEDAGGLTPAKDDNAAPYHFDRRTLPIFKCVDYKNTVLRPPLFAAGPFLCREYCGPLPRLGSGIQDAGLCILTNGMEKNYRKREKNLIKS